MEKQTNKLIKKNKSVSYKSQLKLSFPTIFTGCFLSAAITMMVEPIS